MSVTRKFTIENKQVKTTVVNTESQLEEGLRSLLSTITKDGDIRRVVALDIEKVYTRSSGDPNVVYEKVAIVKLCSATNCLIIQLLQMKSPPCSLSNFLQLSELSFVGVGMKHCLQALEKEYGIKCRNAFDLGELAAKVRETPVLRSYGLVDLADKVDFVDGKKMMSTCYSVAFSNWGAPTLSQQQIEAATRAAFLCFCIGNRLFGGYLSSSSSSSPSSSYYDY